MHIGMILGTNREYVHDIRVEKEIRALINFGHKVTLLVRRIPLDAPKKERFINDNSYIRRCSVKEMGYWKRKIKAFTLIEKTWLPHIEELIVEEKPDILHVHDFNMVPTVVEIAERYKIKVVADLHENKPAAIIARRSIYPFYRKIKSMIQKNYHLWRWHESRYLKKCLKIIVVVPEAIKRLKTYGISEDRITIVSNTEDNTTFIFNSEEADPDILKRYKKFWFISYIGGLGPHRGLDTLIKAIPYSKKRIKNIKLAIVGARGVYKKILIDLIEQLELKDTVELIGWQPFSKVNSYTLASNVSLIPHNDFEHTQTTIPHKLFQAMICKRPVLVSSCQPLKRVVEKSKAGCVFNANDPKDLADKLIYMYKNPKKIKIMGKNGQKAALSKFSWKHDAARLIQLYDEIGKVL